MDGLSLCEEKTVLDDSQSRRTNCFLWLMEEHEERLVETEGYPRIRSRLVKVTRLISYANAMINVT